MPATISDIAKKIGVTKSTVSRVLNSKTTLVPVSAKTRDRIQQLARELDYRPSFSARSLARGRTFTIGLQCGQLSNPFFNELVSLTLGEVEKHGYQLALQVTSWTTAEKNLRGLNALIDRGVDGILNWGTHVSDDPRMCNFITRRKLPMVTRTYEDPEISSVVSDFSSGFREVVGYLKKKGHSRIGYYWNGKFDDPKWVPLQAACREFGVELVGYPGIAWPEQLEGDILKFLHDPNRPGALMVRSDHTAMGVLAVFRKYKINIPGDVAVIGFDGTKVGGLLSPPLTSIGQDMEGLITRSVEILLAQIDDKNAEPQHVTLPTKLIIRESA
jgi:LacI family transcriptional regulator